MQLTVNRLTAFIKVIFFSNLKKNWGGGKELWRKTAVKGLVGRTGKVRF